MMWKHHWIKLNGYEKVNVLKVSEKFLFFSWKSLLEIVIKL